MTKLMQWADWQACYEDAQRDVVDLTDKLHATEARLAEAVALLQQAERDAARYRWLMDKDGNPSISGRFNAVYRKWNGEDGAEGFTATVDAEMAAASARENAP